MDVLLKGLAVCRLIDGTKIQRGSICLHCHYVSQKSAVRPFPREMGESESAPMDNPKASASSLRSVVMARCVLCQKFSFSFRIDASIRNGAANRKTIFWHGDGAIFACTRINIPPTTGQVCYRYHRQWTDDLHQKISNNSSSVLLSSCSSAASISSRVWCRDNFWGLRHWNRARCLHQWENAIAAGVLGVIGVSLSRFLCVRRFVY